MRQLGWQEGTPPQLDPPSNLPVVTEPTPEQTLQAQAEGFRRVWSLIRLGCPEDEFLASCQFIAQQMAERGA